MARKTRSALISPRADHRVTLALQLADGSQLNVEASVRAMRFIGRYSRVSAFGPLGTRLRAQLADRL
ncbi:MAG TPA: hypothetical protein VFF89_11360 [Sphingobium sp.]|nr:hypothetical protein [Sphingobium sp.]